MTWDVEELMFAFYIGVNVLGIWGPKALGAHLMKLE